MQTYRTLVVDNNNEARRELSKMLQERNEITFLGTCSNGMEAIETISDKRPDLIFLEIELPRISGFEVLKNISEDQKPLVIFTSYLKDFALQAFDAEAIDYIQKPYDMDRIQQSLNRVIRLTNHGSKDSIPDQVGDVIQDLKKSHKLERFIIKQSGEYHLIRAENIIWIEADGNYSRIITHDKKFMVRYTLSGFDQQLDSGQFYRISRSQIVNLDYVVKIRDHLYGNFIVELMNGQSLKMSKNYKGLLEALKNF